MHTVTVGSGPIIGNGKIRKLLLAGIRHYQQHDWTGWKHYLNSMCHILSRFPDLGYASSTRLPNYTSSCCESTIPSTSKLALFGYSCFYYTTGNAQGIEQKNSLCYICHLSSTLMFLGLKH